MKKIVLLHWPVSRLSDGSEPGGGIEVMEKAQKKILNEFFETVLYGIGESINNNAERCLVSGNTRFGVYNLYYYYNFWLNHSAKYDYVLSYNGALIALFRQHHTFLYFHNTMNFLGRHDPNFLPLYYFFKNRYHKTHIILVSNYLRQLFELKYPLFPQDHIHVLSNFIDVPKEITDRAISKEVYNRSDIKKIVFVGQWNKGKGLDLLLDAVQRIRQDRNDFELHLIGGYDLWHRDIASVVKIPDDSYIIKVGKLSHENVIKYLTEMHILIVPSVYTESFGLVAIEGLATGLIVVTSNNGALPDIITNELDGFTFDTSKIGDLDRVLVKSLELIKTRQITLRKEALKKINGSYSLDRHKNTLLSILEERPDYKYRL